MMQTPVIDPQAIENLRNLDPEGDDGFLRELIQIFLEDTPQRIGELEQSLASGDTACFTRAAHSIKGSASNMGAEQLRSVAEKLETHSRTQGLSGAIEMVDSIRREFARAKTCLEDIISPA